MNQFAVLFSRTMLALVASFGWSNVYPYAGFSIAGDILWLSLFVAFLVAFFALRPWWRKVALMFGIVSAAASIGAETWSALSWRFGLWYPEFPRLLHPLFSTDGEASYKASDGQLFLLLVVVFSAAAVLSRQLKRKYGSTPTHTSREDGT